MPTILLADDHLMISRGLRKMLEFDFGYRDVHSVTTCSDTMAELKNRQFSNKRHYSHLVLDIGLTDGSALEILPNIIALYPGVNILVYTAGSANIFQRVVKIYGVRYFLSKDAKDEETTSVFQKFLAAKPLPLTDVEAEKNPFSLLSPREIEVLGHLIKMIKPSEIASILNLRRTTVSEYRKRIMAKTNAKNLKELADLASLFNLS